MIIFDLDGTLANCDHRRHLVEDGRHDWQAFYEACDKDEPIQPTIDIMRSLAEKGHPIEIWSGRSESVREKTVDWLRINVGFDFFSDGQCPKIRMRPIGDSTADDILKESWLDDTYEFTKWGSRHPIQYVFDDRPKVIRMWRERGIFVFNCLQHDKEF